MALQNITPQYQAEERTAQFHLRPVPIPNGLAQTGRMLTDAGQGLQKASYGLMLGLKKQKDAMDEEEGALALAKAKNAWLADRSRIMTDLQKKQGSNAEGVTNEYLNGTRNSYDRWSQTLDPKRAREFEIWYEQMDLSGREKMQNHEFSNTMQAAVTLESQNRSDATASFGTTGNLLDLDAALDSHDRLFALKNGGIFTERELADFDRLNPGATPEQRAPYEARVNELNASRQNTIDEALAKRMQYLLNQGDVYSATRFFEAMGKGSLPDASPAAKEAMRVPLENKQKGLEAQSRAGTALTNILSSAGYRALGGTYMTEEMVTAVADYRAEKARSSDPRDREELVAFDALWSVEQKKMAANRAAAQANVASGLFRNPYDPVAYARDLAELQNRINAMPPSLAREDAEDLYNSEYKHYTSLLNSIEEQQRSAQAEQRRIIEERKKDPARQVLESYLVNNVACMSEPVFTIGSGADYTEFDGRDKEKLWAFLVRANIRNGGPLTDEGVNQIWMTCTGEISAEPRRKAVARVGRLFHDMGLAENVDPDILAQAAPWLIDYAVNSAYRLSNGGKNTDKAVETDIDKDVLLEMKREFYVPRWDGHDFWDTAHIIAKAVKPDGRIDYQALENAFGWPRYRTGRKAAGPNGPTGGYSNKEVDQKVDVERKRHEFATYGAQGGTGQDFYDKVGGVQ